ncbi:hypothetical protein BDZ91DRAFT_668735, partial [Kalaharituber pfeilii]
LLLQPTSPNVEPGWVDSPTRRGTFDLLISCVLTLVICVWTAVHPDVPAPEHRGFWNSIATRSWWVVVGLLAPEFLLWQAISQYLAARNIYKRLVELKIDGLYNGYGPPVLQLRPDTVMKLVELGAIAPNSGVFNQEPIKDKSKADSLAKLLVCGQAGWMVIQCIARKSTGLPVTLLEINTVMHVVCALFMYFLWLKKPQEVNVPNVIIDSTPGSTLTLLFSTTLSRPRDGNSKKILFWRQAMMSGVGNLTDLWKSKGSSVWMAVLTAVYGSIHLTVWNSHFPTVLERNLWRASCCLIAFWFPTSWVARRVWHWVWHSTEGRFATTWVARRLRPCFGRYNFFVFLVLHTLARVFIFTEAFASLRSLSQGAYDTVPWTEFWPHF